jgi:putative transposase
VGCLDQAAVADVQSAVSSACRELAVQVLRGAVLADHVHLVVSFRPNTRLSDFVRLVKSVAAVRANRRVPGAVRWARGFYAATVHKRDLPAVIRYVAHQFARHPDRMPTAARRRH